jgi:hypothetical protein
MILQDGAMHQIPERVGTRIARAQPLHDRAKRLLFLYGLQIAAGLARNFCLFFAEILLTPLCICRFKIQNHSIGKDELAAWACIRLDRLRTGFRFIHCLDAKGMESRGVLLVRITKQVL